MIGLRPSRDEESLGTALWLLVAQAGHYRCDGWTFEERDAVLSCACGAPLYEIRAIDGFVESALAEPADDAG
jgi:hypothetical protein